MKKVCDFKVKPIKLPKVDTRKFKGEHLLRDMYSNLFIAAKKKSGKTTLIGNLIKECCDKRTEVIIFSGTVNKDPTWDVIREYCDSKDIQIRTYNSIVDEDGKDELTELKREIEQHLMDEKNARLTAEAETDIIPPLITVGAAQGEGEKKRPPREPTTKVPRYFLVLDDMSSQLKRPSVPALLKENRHNQVLCVISSQYPWDIHPMARTNMNDLILFKGFDDKLLKKISSEFNTSVSYERFKKMYEDATKEPFNFFYILGDGTFRKNFDQEYPN